MKFMKLGSKPDSFQTDGDNIRYVATELATDMVINIGDVKFYLHKQLELVEGQAYVIAGLVPHNSDSETLYLQAKGSTTKWQPLSPIASGQFEPFFNPRKAVILSNLGEVPLSSEFDIAALLVYVGEVYTASHQNKQWGQESFASYEILSSFIDSYLFLALPMFFTASWLLSLS